VKQTGKRTSKDPGRRKRGRPPNTYECSYKVVYNEEVVTLVLHKRDDEYCNSLVKPGDKCDYCGRPVGLHNRTVGLSIDGEYWAELCAGCVCAPRGALLAEIARWELLTSGHVDEPVTREITRRVAADLRRYAQEFELCTTVGGDL